MRINHYLILFFCASLCIFYSCSSSEEVKKESRNTEDTTYVFDKVPPENSYKIGETEATSKTIYVVQIGAFSNFERAGSFAKSSQLKLKKDIKVDYDESRKLYLVRVNQNFYKKSDALTYRDEIRNYPEFKDAWVVEMNLKDQKKK
jgi:hypothetical protein